MVIQNTAEGAVAVEPGRIAEFTTLTGALRNKSDLYCCVDKTSELIKLMHFCIIVSSRLKLSAEKKLQIVCACVCARAETNAIKHYSQQVH